MKIIMCSVLILLALVPAEDAYQIYGDIIEFSYSGSGKQVYVSGNFNSWTKEDGSWKMTFNRETQEWHLRKSINDVRSHGSFLEFTFRVDGKSLPENCLKLFVRLIKLSEESRT